ncbi:interleukin-6 receptor subunit beta-like [Platysternon megacephalum]|uniref:superoxide dismutase n=1 Tax=Platysternon megacephalum TaxID=55544 RepID=A0A4D9E839_9SAUR|nr:interleukin-6 receptor subunit beta-like [Platysternon megacephalum]
MKLHQCQCLSAQLIRKKKSLSTVLYSSPISSPTHCRMFTEHPDTKSYFTHFKGMGTAEEMEQSDQVRSHGKRVLTTINDLVQHLDSTDAFLGIVNPLGKKHAMQLKVDPKNFRIICDIILQLMEEKYGGDCKASFQKVTNEICTRLNNAYKEAGW